VIRWRKEGREDILKHLAITSNNPNDQSGAFTSDSCPFLRRNEEQNVYCCDINDTKPFNCKNYPDDGVCEYTTNLN
jgi:Fe-S-cluster containining protein